MRTRWYPPGSPPPSPIALFSLRLYLISCVQQTVLDLLSADRRVYIIADAVTSMREEDRNTALRHLQRQGAMVVTAESLLYDVQGDANSPSFRDLSKLTKSRAEMMARMK